MADASQDIVVAFDTANEVIACGIGRRGDEGAVQLIAEEYLPARRASNTRLLSTLDALMAQVSISRSQIGLVSVGRGPGSFTGVRIAMATAKGMASALGVPLLGISTLDALAWQAWLAGVRGRVLVVADAMRKEVYPAYFQLDEAGAQRLTEDRVVKAAAFALDIPHEGITLLGDALFKYAELFDRQSLQAEERLWTPQGSGLLAATEQALRSGSALTRPADVLPIYTRLSDAEESERARLAKTEARDLVSGVQHAGAPTFNIRPMDVASVSDAARIERAVMGTDAWSERAFADDLAQANRIWWMAQAHGELMGYGGALIVDGDAQILKVATVPKARRQGIACRILSRILEDARNLAATTCSLEVRASNAGAIAFYESCGMTYVGTRPGYYSDREDALIYTGDINEMLPHLARTDVRQVAGIGLDEREAWQEAEPQEVTPPRILAIETSCDETAGAVVEGGGAILSDVVASQIDFHARFGGVVPEIASRKHIEAICGVAEAALQDAHLAWRDLDAVAATYAPGLVGALVVGVAFAKGAAWALDVPYIGVNHLEGHIYANKLGCSQDEPFCPPAVVSLISGGNTMLVHMQDWQRYRILGATIDDAVGEAFDKVAKALGLPYPGGPHISRLAKEGDPQAIHFPRALMHSGDYRFSLSGLKTAVITYIQQAQVAGTLDVADVCASFEAAVIDVQVSKAARALDEAGANAFCLGGGVAANPELRRAYEKMCASRGARLIMPPLESCGDNAALIALVALDRYRQGLFSSLDSDAYAHADLSVPY